MKKEYIKPYLAVESFQLDAAIAGACGSDNMMALNHSVNDCTLMDGQGENYNIDYFGAACGLAGGVDIVTPDNPDGACYMVFNAADQFLTS